MLFARAISNGVKFFCPDIFLGATVYTPDELGATVNEDGEVIELPDSIRVSVSTRQAAPQDEIWRQWKSPSDAILWAEKQLPQMSMDQIQAEFNALPTTNGKKAPAWVEKVKELKQS